MLHHRDVKHLGIFKSAPHDFRILDIIAVISNCYRPHFDQVTDLGKFFPFDILRDSADDIHVGVGVLGPVLDKFDRFLIVNPGHSVGHAAYRRKASGGGGPTAGLNSFLIFMARFTKMHVHVDQAGNNYFAFGINNPAFIKGFYPLLHSRRTPRNFDNNSVFNKNTGVGPKA